MLIQVSISDLVKCLAATQVSIKTDFCNSPLTHDTEQGPKVRVNAILPGLLLTEWVRFLCKTSSLHNEYHTEPRVSSKSNSAY